MKLRKLAHEPLACRLGLYKCNPRRWKQERTGCEPGEETEVTADTCHQQTAPWSAWRRRDAPHRTDFSALLLIEYFAWTVPLFLIVHLKMPAGTFERTSPSAVAATPASGDSTPEKPRTLTESRKVSKLFLFCLYFSYLFILKTVSSSEFFFFLLF